MADFVKDDCDVFLKKIMPADASEAQKSAMQLAFFAGAKSTLMMIQMVSTETSEDVACAFLDELEKELTGYFLQLKDDTAARLLAAEGLTDGIG